MQSALTALAVITFISAEPKLPAPRLWRPPEVKLVSAGAPPLAPMRYALAKQGEGSFTLEAGGRWRMKTSSAEATSELPSLSLPFSYTVEAPTKFAFEFGAAQVTGPRAGQEAATQAILDLLKGVRGTVQFDARGLAQSVSIIPSANDPEFARDFNKVTVGTHYALELGRSAFMHLLTPLPEEPIGVGATWRVERPQTRGTISYTEVATFTLVSRDANGARLSMTLGGKPDPLGGVRPDQIDIAVSGGGDVDVEFARPFPVRLEDKVSLHAFTGPRDAQRVEHEGAMTGRLQLASRRTP